MDNSITEKDDALARREQRKLTRIVRRQRGKASYYTDTPACDLYDCELKGDNGEPVMVKRTHVTKTVAPPSLIKHIAGQWEHNGKTVFPVPVVHMTNSQSKDERNFRPPVGSEVLEAFAENEWICFAGKHLYPKGLMRLFRKTFPKAVDACYIRSLGAPTIGNGIFTDLSFTFTDITSVNSDGDIIHGGADGRGSISPQHPVFERIGTVCPIQIRIWNPHKGVFAKGILVPDDRCVTEDGLPDIWVDWLQVKGAWKGLAKERCGLNNGAFDENGLLVDESKLASVHFANNDSNRATDLDRWFLGVLQVWDKPGTIRWCFEVLERVRDTDLNRKYVVEFLQESLQALEDKGGLNGILQRLADEDPKIELTCRLTEALADVTGQELSPMQIPFVWDFIQDELQRKLYHLRQGAGKRSERFVVVMNSAVPRGHCVIGPARNPDGSIRFKHGDEVAVTRFPMIAPQSLRVLKCITPSSRRYSHLVASCCIKTDKGLRVPQQCIYISPFDVEMMQGDDDGDTVLVDSDPRVVSMFKERISIIQGKPDVAFLIEPGKDADAPKTKVALCNPDGSVDPLSVEIIGLDGRGPVGPLTYYLSCFIALGDYDACRAVFVLIQEAIDSGKHVVILSDPEKLVQNHYWKEVESGVFSPVNAKAKFNGKWYDETGCLNMKEFAKWFKRRTGGLKMSDILTWRPSSGEKRTRDKEWCIKESESGENLVHWCNKASYHLWQAWKDDNDVSRCEPVDLVGLVPASLGYPLSEMRLDKRSYQRLLNRSGLGKFQSVLKVARNKQYDVEERNRLVESASLELAHSLRQLSSKELATIWYNELKDGSTKSAINRAFRAVCFDGSPVLHDLGVEMNTICPYLQGDKLDDLFGKLLNAVDEGKYVDIFYAVEDWALFAEDHTDENGYSGDADECDHCKKLLRAKAVGHARNSKQTREEVRKTISAMCSSVNKSLRTL